MDYISRSQARGSDARVDPGQNADRCRLQLKKEAETAWGTDKDQERCSVPKPAPRKHVLAPTKRVEQFRKNMRRWMIGEGIVNTVACRPGDCWCSGPASIPFFLALCLYSTFDTVDCYRHPDWC